MQAWLSIFTPEGAYYEIITGKSFLAFYEIWKMKIPIKNVQMKQLELQLFIQLNSLLMKIFWKSQWKFCSKVI